MEGVLRSGIGRIRPKASASAHMNRVILNFNACY